MKKNVGGYDRFARLLVGPLLIVVGAAGYAGYLVTAIGPVPQFLGAVLAFAVGLVLLVTGLVRKCPLNALFGVDTYRPSGDREEPPVEKPATRRSG